MEKLTGITFIVTMIALVMGRPDRDPIWPNEFAWNSAGPISGYHCTQILESADPHTWHDNYFCQIAGPGIKNIGMRWSSAGKCSFSDEKIIKGSLLLYDCLLTLLFSLTNPLIYERK